MNTLSSPSPSPSPGSVPGVAAPGTSAPPGSRPAPSVPATARHDAGRHLENPGVCLTAAERTALQGVLDSDPVTWIGRNFYIEDPRDPYTGEQFSPGPIRLHPIQKRILRAALLKVDGLFPWSTVVFSTIKKSGKTRLAAAVAAWYAATQGMYNEVYCLANDGGQSADRILSAVKKAVDLAQGSGGDSVMASWVTRRTHIEVPNGTIIQALPCDAEGQAGSNPGLTVWSEMWGYSQKHKERLWTEMTVPPTRWGRALRWVESYAGYTGESLVLENLYHIGKSGERHPLFPDLPVSVIYSANMFFYWDEGDAARRMPWQTTDYYTQEAAVLTPSEFDRIHRNQWVDPVTKAIPIEWWDECIGDIPPLTKRSKVVMGVDASVSGDCTACVLVSRHPGKKDTVMVRAVRVWTPPRGGKMDLEATVWATLWEWYDKYDLREVTFDSYQLHNMMTRVRKAKKVKLHDFGQAGERSQADKQLLDLIVARRIVHGGDPQLRAHVDNAQAKTLTEKYRFTKQDVKQGSPLGAQPKPIDALVALSMASDRCLHLRI